MQRIQQVTGPAAAYSEKHVIGGALTEPDVVLAVDLDPSDFHVPQTRLIWATMVARVAANDPWRTPFELLLSATQGDPVEAQRLEGWLEVSMARYEDAIAYAERVRTASLTRRVMAEMARVPEIVETEAVGPDLIARLVDTLLALQARKSRATSKTLRELVDECARGLLSDEPSIGDRIPIGLRAIDAALNGGWQRAIVSVLAARTSHGKSALLLQSAIHAAVHGHSVLLLSAEDLETDTGMRATSRATGITLSDLSNRSEAIRQRLRLAYEKFGATAVAEAMDRITLVQIAGKTYRQIVALSHVRPADLVMVDYLQRIDTGGEKRYEAFTGAMNAFDNEAKRTGAAWVVASQFKRSDNELPQLSDLREAGTIEEIAKCVIALHRPYKSHAKYADDRVWVGVLKSSNGDLANALYAWDGSMVAIRDSDPGPERDVAAW